MQAILESDIVLCNRIKGVAAYDGGMKQIFNKVLLGTVGAVSLISTEKTHCTNHVLDCFLTYVLSNFLESLLVFNSDEITFFLHNLCTC